MIIFKGGEKIDISLQRRIPLSIAVYTKLPAGSNVTPGIITPSKTAFCTITPATTNIFEIKSNDIWAFALHQSGIDQPLLGITRDDLDLYAYEHFGILKSDMEQFINSQDFRDILWCFRDYVINKISKE